MSYLRVPEHYTIWRRLGTNWFPLRTYLSKQQALDLAKDWSIDGNQYRVTQSTGAEVARFGRPPRPQRNPSPSSN